MSIVRYTNKQTGVVTVYESTSYYDPILKQSEQVMLFMREKEPHLQAKEDVNRLIR